MPGKCFVLNCKTGINKNTQNIPVFKAPRDENARNEWSKLVSKEDRVLHDKAYVCALHFEEDMIEKEYVLIIAGKEHRIPRKRWRLKPNALPTKLDVVVTKATRGRKPKQAPAKRSPSQENPKPKAKRTRKTNACIDPTVGKHVNMSVSATVDKDFHFWKWITQFTLPRAWGRQISEQSVTLFYCAERPEEWIHLVWSNHDGIVNPIPKIFIRSTEVIRPVTTQYFVATERSMLALLDSLIIMPLCQGISMEEVAAKIEVASSNVSGESKLTSKILLRVTVTGSKMYDKCCSVFTKGCEFTCASCKYLLQLLSKIEVDKSAEQSTAIKNANRRLKRLQKSNDSLKEKIKHLQREISQQKRFQTN